ncbi:MAG: fumarylacetoacetate hydrolase family protein [Acidobacteriota bacterium]|nr:fumarylacetoacetate hydrolase family protein [Acidobacteriota bacterium]
MPTLPYLQTEHETAFEITVEAWLRPARMTDSVRLSRGSFREMYWTLAQMIAHHTSNGCPIHTGDLIASGAISGPEKMNRGCLLELT